MKLHFKFKDVAVSFENDAEKYLFMRNFQRMNESPDAEVIMRLELKDVDELQRHYYHGFENTGKIVVCTSFHGSWSIDKEKADELVREI